MLWQMPWCELSLASVAGVREKPPRVLIDEPP
jgi:hypothetical protein